MTLVDEKTELSERIRSLRTAALERTEDLSPHRAPIVFEAYKANRTEPLLIQAARALGVSNATIMFRHLLPNAMVATMTFLPFIVSSSVMTLTALDFLGFGLPPGSPSLGELLSQGKSNVQAPWLGFTGFFSVAIMLSLLIFIGEGVRDAFDPRKTFR